MKCPYVLKGGQYGCGQCLPCLIKKRSEWTFRIMQEAKLHADSIFCTLTYDDDHWPAGGSLCPRDITLWLKRVRKCIIPRRIRYYYVGEYGDRTGRPHFHCIIFGLDASYQPILSKLWGKSENLRFTVDNLTIERAQYAAGYVTKKLTKVDDPRLYGRFPEYSRMSLGTHDKKGGIGAPAMKQIAKSFLTSPAAMAHLASEGDVPAFLKMQGRTHPISRYLRSKLREQLSILPADASIRRSSILETRFQTNLSLVRSGTLTLEEFDKAQGFVRSPETVDQMVLNLTSRYSLKKRSL